MSDRITEAEAATALEVLRRAEYSYPETEDALLSVGRLIVDWRQLRELIVDRASPGQVDRNRAFLITTELIEEARAIRAEQGKGLT